MLVLEIQFWTGRGVLGKYKSLYVGSLGFKV